MTRTLLVREAMRGFFFGDIRCSAPFSNSQRAVKKIMTPKFSQKFSRKLDGISYFSKTYGTCRFGISSIIDSGIFGVSPRLTKLVNQVRRATSSSPEYEIFRYLIWENIFPLIAADKLIALPLDMRFVACVAAELSN